MILRLIDIVLIVLFGFISIATIESQRKVELAPSESISTIDVGKENNLTITVDAWGYFFVQEVAAPVSENYMKDYILEHLSKLPEGDSLHVRIRADRAAPMGNVRRIVQTCDLYNIRRSLIVENVINR